LSIILKLGQLDQLKIFDYKNALTMVKIEANIINITEIIEK